MKKLNREINELKMNQSKERSMNFVMNEINKESKRSFSFSFNKFILVPALSIIVALVLIFTLSNNSDPNITHTDPLLDNANTERLAELSYITGNLVVSSFTLYNPSSLMNLADTDDFEFETDILEFNTYFDMLRVFLEDDPFADSFVVETLEIGEYSTKITFTVDNSEYIFLVNLEDEILTGTLDVNGLILQVEGKLEGSNDELTFEIKASNNQDYIEIHYQVENDDEIEKTYELTSYINGVTKNKEIEISIEDDEIKVKITEDDKEYELEKEIEDGLVVYHLSYSIGEVEGEATIIETVDELGNPIYKYNISEDGFEKEIDIDNDDEDDEEDEEDEEDEDEEETNNEIIPNNIKYPKNIL